MTVSGINMYFYCPHKVEINTAYAVSRSGKGKVIDSARDPDPR
jgi:hypothetical protein